MGEYRRKRSNIRFNEQRNKIILSMIIRDEVNSDLLPVSVDVSHEYMGWHKGICFLLAPKFHY